MFIQDKSSSCSKGRLNLLHTGLVWSKCALQAFKWIEYILVDWLMTIQDYTWRLLFLRSKNETPEFLKDFLMMIQRNLQAQVITVHTDRGTEFLNNLVPEVKGIDYDNYDPVPPRQNVVYSRETDCHNKGWNSLQSFTEEITSAHVGIEFEDSISLQFASLEAVRIFVAHEEVYVAQPEGFVDIQIIQKKNVTFKKALYRCLKQDPRACHKVVRLGINPMIQPEPEDLPKDNPKLEIAVLRSNGGNGNLNPIQMLILQRQSIKKAQDLKTKTSANSDLKLSR
ncbi:hypothetical protein Tco_1030367 [Tanacetum coccineum]|uniref:Integrase catalytic domain-containing protein n=1 Tax=Tanacetum coccineum TaxID=301880 RepID=A0ABQ5G6K4_9ASTR